MRHCRSCGGELPEGTPANHFSCRPCYATATRKLVTGHAAPISNGDLDALIASLRDTLNRLENLKNTST